MLYFPAKGEADMPGIDDAKRLVAQMTLEEKASLCSGLDFWHLKRPGISSP
jgi:hypothetical protein